jgi:hypothetical protein
MDSGSCLYTTYSVTAEGGEGWEIEQTMIAGEPSRCVDPRLTETPALIRSGILDADQLIRLIGGLWPHFFQEGPKLSAKERC